MTTIEEEDEELLITDNPPVMIYHIICPIGIAEGSTIVNKVMYFNGINGVKCFKLGDTDKASRKNLMRQVDYSHTLRHLWNCDEAARDNILNLVGTSKSDGYYFVVFNYMNHGSLLSLMARRFPLGLPEFWILYALCTTLKALALIHANNRYLPFHRQISAAHIYGVGYNGSIRFKLGYAATVYDVLEDQASDSIYSSFSVCRWAAAPEVYGLSSDDTKYGAAADIWLVGITALELAYGGLKLGGRDDLEHLIKIMHRMRRLPSKLNPNGCHCWGKEREKGILSCLGHSKKRTTPIGFEYRPKEWTFSKKFVDLVLACLDLDPTKRPTATELLERNVFDSVRDLVRLRL